MNFKKVPEEIDDGFVSTLFTRLNNHLNGIIPDFWVHIKKSSKETLSEKQQHTETVLRVDLDYLKELGIIESFFQYCYFIKAEEATSLFTILERIKVYKQKETYNEDGKSTSLLFNKVCFQVQKWFHC